MSAMPALRLDGVSKKYRLFASPRARLREALLRRPEHEEFWALRNVSLDLPAGRTLGVLGLNGSGKSTLLKIIAGILEPSEGKIEVNGRVAALLELGAGFNPELSGRENVITNARILGLTHRQSLDRLAEVENFADIGRYFDQPVKTYSSGMYMRVAFAMSICVDPDILIIDEALAVGDVKFQEKCYRRLKEFQAKGRTILFVTHDRASVTQLCDDAILLHHGQLITRGEPADVVAIYTELLTTGQLRGTASRRPSRLSLAQPQVVEAPERESAAAFLADLSPEDRLCRHPLYNPNEARFGYGGAAVVDAMVICEQEVNPASFVSRSVADLYIRLRFDEAMEPIIGVTLHTVQGVQLYGVNTSHLGMNMRPVRAGEVRIVRVRAPLPLAHGPAFLGLAVASGDRRVCDQRSRALALDILRDRPFEGVVDLAFTIAEENPRT